MCATARSTVSGSGIVPPWCDKLPWFRLIRFGLEQTKPGLAKSQCMSTANIDVAHQVKCQKKVDRMYRCFLDQ
jgi:hypothetical protein